MGPEQKDLAGDLLVAARRQAGVSQEELARRAGVSQAMISTYERHRRQPSIPTLWRLLEAVGMEVRVELTELELTGYRPMTVAQTGAKLTGGTSDPWLHVREFLTEFTFEEAPGRSRLLGQRPRPTGDARWDAFLGALGEHLAFHDGAPVPHWTCEPERFLSRAWYCFDTPSARVEARITSPASFLRRGVFLERRSLDRA
ncbi:MAG TPA: helix-turn-helix transcriptional regulator [Acidimicrobiales bacterium]|nr:helix-turn-helix transcriptional regulator [Acidimicrobiales bacterium]